MKERDSIRCENLSPEMVVLYRAHSYLTQTAGLFPGLQVPAVFDDFVSLVPVIRQRYDLRRNGLMPWSELMGWLGKMPSFVTWSEIFPDVQIKLYGRVVAKELKPAEFVKEKEKFLARHADYSWPMSFDDYYNHWAVATSCPDREHERQHREARIETAKQMGLPMPNCEINIRWGVTKNNGGTKVNFIPFINVSNSVEMVGNKTDLWLEYSQRVDLTEKAELSSVDVIIRNAIREERRQPLVFGIKKLICQA